MTATDESSAVGTINIPTPIVYRRNLLKSNYACEILQ